MADDKQKSFSFGFSKKKEGSKLVESAIRDENKDDITETEFVTSLEDKAVNSTKPKEEKKVLVIPLIKKNNWNLPTPKEIENDQGKESPIRTKETTKSDVARTGDDITDQAVQELVSDARRQQEDWEDRGENRVSDREIPLLMQNKVPDGTETDDRLDVSIRPDEPATANYEEVPIEEYGMALLRGMGFKDGQGIGRNNKSVTPIVAVARPKGLGLGADRSLTLQQQEQGKSNGKNPDQDEQLQMKKGGFCIIQAGRHEGLYATIEGLDEDNARVVVKLAIGNSSVTLNQMAVKLVTRKEFDKNSKYLNKSKVEKFKEEESKKHRKDRSSSRDRDSGRDSDRHADTRKDRERERHSRSHRDHDRDRYNPNHRSQDDLSDTTDQYDSRLGKDKKKKKRRKSDSDSPSSYADDRQRRKHDKHRQQDRSRSRSPLMEQRGSKHKESKHQPPNPSKLSWLRPHLRVRIIDEKYKKGKYYKSKVIIEDVISLGTCICRNDGGKVLEDLNQNQLETVIPKTKGSHVMVVTGTHRGKIGEVLERDTSKCRAMVQIIPDCDEILSLDYDVICEYAGNIHDLV